MSATKTDGAFLKAYKARWQAGYPGARAWPA